MFKRTAGEIERRREKGGEGIQEERRRDRISEGVIKNVRDVAKERGEKIE